MKTNLEAALDLLKDGLPLPIDLTTALLNEGIDVANLKPNTTH